MLRRQACKVEPKGGQACGASRASSDPWRQRGVIAFQALESGGVFQQFCDLVFAGQTSRAPPHMPTIRCGDRMANVDKGALHDPEIGDDSSHRCYRPHHSDRQGNCRGPQRRFRKHFSWWRLSWSRFSRRRFSRPGLSWRAGISRWWIPVRWSLRWLLSRLSSIRNLLPDHIRDNRLLLIGPKAGRIRGTQRSPSARQATWTLACQGATASLWGVLQW